jgi:hypothetical protein
MPSTSTVRHSCSVYENELLEIARVRPAGQQQQGRQTNTPSTVRRCSVYKNDELLWIVSYYIQTAFSVLVGR